MKEYSVKGKMLVEYLVSKNKKVLREDKDKNGYKVYVFWLSDEDINELKEYISKTNKFRYY